MFYARERERGLEGERQRKIEILSCPVYLNTMRFIEHMAY
jgi:hypothetical protein